MFLYINSLIIRYGTVYFSVKRHELNNSVLPSIFEQLSKKHPHKVCFYFENQVWTFKQVEYFSKMKIVFFPNQTLTILTIDIQINELSNKVAHVFMESGIQRGDTVALMMDNRPEYVAIWLGLAKIGIVTALVNYNLRGNPLLHALQIVNSKAIIFSSDFSEGI